MKGFFVLLAQMFAVLVVGAVIQALVEYPFGIHTSVVTADHFGRIGIEIHHTLDGLVLGGVGFVLGRSKWFKSCFER